MQVEATGTRDRLSVNNNVVKFRNQFGVDGLLSGAKILCQM